MAKLRYDLAAEAITGLQRYLDTCPDDRNTMALLTNTGKAVDKLKRIEQDIPQRHDPGAPYTFDTASAIGEIERKIANVKEKAKPLEGFLIQYREELLALKDAVVKLQEISAVFGSIRDIERQLECVRNKTTMF